MVPHKLAEMIRSLTIVLGGALFACTTLPTTAIPSASPTAPTLPTATVTATASPSPSPTTYSNATLGYRVVLPAGYRVSSCESWVDVGLDRMGIDFFTPLGDQEELELNIGDIPPTERARDFSIRAYRNADSASAVDWARAQPENRDSTVDATTISGHDAARITTADVRTVSYAVRADGRIYAIVTDIRREGMETERFLGAVAASLQPIALGPFPTLNPKAPRDAAREVATALANAFSQRDAAGVSLRMRGCTLGMHAVIDAPQPFDSCCILNRSIRSFVEALRPALASGTVRVVVDPAVQSAGAGNEGRLFVVSQWTENGKTRRIDLQLNELGGRWYWSGAVHHFQRSDLPVCYGPIWGGTPC